MFKRFYTNILLTIFIITGSVFCIFCNYTLGQQSAPGLDSQANENIRALSLKTLCNELNGFRGKGSYPENLLHFNGITELLGYIFDRSQDDIILFGFANPQLPPLNFEDFVISVRNKWLKYAELKGNTYYYSYPGCSIDPDEKVWNRLAGIYRNINTSRSEVDIKGYLNEWRTTCNNPQNVRVLGIPFNTGMGSTMVTADYDMKSIVDGSDDLEIPGLVSVADMYIEEARKSIKNKTSVTSGMLSNRFWFYGDTCRYDSSGGLFIIQTYPVGLLTEEMYYSHHDQSNRGNSSDKKAQIFADNFSALFDAIKATRPIFAKLDEVFRLVMIAHVLNENFGESGLPRWFESILNDYKIRSASVNRQLPGRSNVKEFSYREEYSNGYTSYQYWFPSCGGVDAQPGPLLRCPIGNPGALKTEIITSRPYPNSLSWNIDFRNTTYYTPYHTIRILQRANKRSKYIRILNIRFEKGQYTIFDGIDVLYTGNDISGFGERLKMQMGRSRQKTVYMNFSDMPEVQIADFMRSFNPGGNDLRSEFQIKSLKGTADHSYLEKLTAPGPRIVENSVVMKTIASEDGATVHQVSMQFEVKVRNLIERLVLVIKSVAESKVRKLLELIRERLLNKQEEPGNILDIINKNRQNLRDIYQGDDTDVDIEIIDNTAGLNHVILFEVKSING